MADDSVSVDRGRGGGHRRAFPGNRLVCGWLRRRWVILPLCMLLTFALPQLFGGRMKVDSGLYAGLSLHQLDHGTWWTLMAGDQPYFRKPPLVFWIHGAAFELLGRSLWAMRLPGMLAALGCVAMTALIGRRLGGWRIGLLSGVILATNIPFIRFLQRFILDYWHTLFVLMAVWMVIEAARKNRAALIVAAGIPIGLAMMCKPVIAIVALPILAVWLLVCRRPRLACWILPAAVVALIIAAPWHLSMIIKHGDAFINEYFGRQMVGRATGESTGTGFVHEPWYWYFEHLGREYWPWMIPLALSIVHVIRRGLTVDLKWLFNLCAIWSVSWITIVSFSSDKHDRYIMQVLPMLGMLAALWLARWSPPEFRRGFFRSIHFGIPAALAVAVIVMVLPWRYNRDEDPEWSALYQFMQEHPQERFDLGTLPYRDGGRLYFFTGIWPHNNVDALGHTIEPQAGDLVLHAKSENPIVQPDDAVVFDQGDLLVVRHGHD